MIFIFFIFFFFYDIIKYILIYNIYQNALINLIIIKNIYLLNNKPEI